MDIKRVFLIVLDSLGMGEMPDAALYGDEGSNTLKSICELEKYDFPTLASLGLFNIFGNREIGKPSVLPLAAYCRAAERSAGKDTTTGHWEIAGLVSEKPMPVYPDGFPKDLLDSIKEATGYDYICNKPYSGTDVIRDYGREHIETGKLIIYTSADSVYQVAAHTDVVPLDKLYTYCEKAREMLCGDHAVGRVIARPFTGEYPNYVRTADRRDFSIAPPKRTLLNVLKDGGLDVIGVGKIGDIFAMSGITETYPTHGNREGMEILDSLTEKDFHGLCFANLVDFDMMYGHRNDVDGYGKALAEFDDWLDDFIPKMNRDDLLIITADHGCDPATPSTDHSREYVPVLIYGSNVIAQNLATRTSFADTGKTIADVFRLKNALDGTSYIQQLTTGVPESALAALAISARDTAYAPYSQFKVGAALLCENGNIYSGCNIENSSFGATLCAERSAIAKAISAGERSFTAIAVAGSENEKSSDYTLPCGICRQVLSEFCSEDFRIIAVKSQNDYKVYTLDELFPMGFKLNK